MFIKAVISNIYFVLLGLRRLFYGIGLRKRYCSSIPVVSIGSVEFGGAGKTPVTIYLIELLKEHGFTPILLSRGYGRKSRELVMAEGHIESGNYEKFGDEPYMINQKTGCWVIIHANRAKSAKVAETLPVKKPVLVLDDGFQQMKLKTDIDILLVSGGQRIGDRNSFPFKTAGSFARSFRDNPIRISEADIILVKGEMIDDIAKYADKPLFCFRYEAQKRYNQEKAYLISAIARGEDFLAEAKKSGIDTVGHRFFRDHYAFSEKDLNEVRKASEGCDFILTTEKDFYKIHLKHRKRFSFEVFRISVTIDDREHFTRLFLGKLSSIGKI